MGGSGIQPIPVSHLLQMRGLKLAAMDDLSRGEGVASFTDAWIETYQSARVFSQCHVASFTDAWIETGLYVSVIKRGASHLLQMRALKLTTASLHNTTLGSHLLQMRGLKLFKYLNTGF